ncbi:hypothetical protein AVEN_217991-1 [Araneus ventricosus]|uniref:Uncharacterized protein n=1 Tax=Araneus ventricosus TaxID=182803 RepID=A0A4Y2H080_ARAVE|nr:hypothetical protein AVEN_161949-1 [Araneus ventricosus]GBM59652.1 hypothetical protein AVEN_217991-1 [Araneus ventricosus]
MDFHRKIAARVRYGATIFVRLDCPYETTAINRLIEADIATTCLLTGRQERLPCDIPAVENSFRLDCIRIAIVKFRYRKFCYVVYNTAYSRSVHYECLEFIGNMHKQIERLKYLRKTKT